MFFKESDLYTICTNHSTSLNIETTSSFHANAPTNVLTGNKNDIIESFLSDSVNSFEQFDLDTMCTNLTPPNKKDSVMYRTRKHRVLQLLVLTSLLEGNLQDTFKSYKKNIK